MIRNMEMPPEIMALLVETAQAHGISIGMLRGKGRERLMVRARRDVARILSHEPYGCSSTQIGRYLNRHHTAILHLLHQVDVPTAEDRIVKRLGSLNVGLDIRAGLEARLEALRRHRERLAGELDKVARLEQFLVASLKELEGIAA